MRLQTCIIVIVSLCLTTFSATTGMLKGVVKDGTTDKPVESAIVRLVEKGLADTTDANGSFLFSFPVSVLSKAFLKVALIQPHYMPGKGILFANPTKGTVFVNIFNLSGKVVSTLNNSIIDQGIWLIPVNNLVNGMYLCKIKTTYQMKSFQFIMNGTGQNRGSLVKAGDIFSGNKLSKAGAASVDSLITSKTGYVSDTLLWTEKTADSVVIILREPGNPLPPSVRIITPFDLDWLFYKGDASGADKATFEDGSWKSVRVPHDWSIEGPFSQSNSTGKYGAYLPSGISWYRKHFSLASNLSGKRIFIEFDGVMANSMVYVNGAAFGPRPYGYMQFRYDITDQVKIGSADNVIAVKTQTSAQPASRWYTGSGIYRHVRLITTSPVHIDKYSTFVTTQSTSTAIIKTKVLNEGTTAKGVKVKAAVYDPSGTMLAPITSAVQDITPAGSAEFTIEVPVANAKLWSLESPNMYKVVTTVVDGNTDVDDETTPFGIRTFKFDPETGFSLNGKSMKLKGVCLHHDMSGLGAAVPLRAMQRRLAILKSIGVNAIRTAHNPFDPMVLDLFDQMGFLVMDEFFDVWTQPKYSMKDYSVNWTNWHVTDATDIVKQHRNHPSIIIYSIGNEIRDALATRTPIATELVKICHTNDSTRPVTQGLFRPLDNKDYPGATLSVLDVFGVNYHTTELLSAITENAPHHSGVMTEDAPSTSSWNSFYAKNPQITGVFLWTGAAYLGEATQTDEGWPYVGGSNKDGEFGLIDRVGTIKDIGYSYQGIWSTNPVNKPKTSTAAAAKIVLSVDHPTIMTDWEDVAYVKAAVVDASGNIVTNSSVSITFTASGTAGEIKAVDSGIYEAGESFRGNTRKAYKGICFAIVQMSTAGSITISASASGLTGSSVTVTGKSGPFVPCPSCD